MLKAEARPFSKLRGRMAEQGYSISTLARAIDMCYEGLSMRLNGTREWRLYEIYIVVDELDIPEAEIAQYFPRGVFVPK